MSEIESVNTTKYANGHRQCSGVAYIGDYDYGRRSSIANYYSGISICPQTPTIDTQNYKRSNNTVTAILNTASVRTCANRDWHRRRRICCKNNGAEMQQKFDYNRNFQTIITAGDDDWKSATKRIAQPLTRALSNCISYTLPCWMVKLRSSHVIKLIFAGRKYSNSNKNQNKNNNYKLTTRTRTTTSTTNAITALTILATGLTHLTEASLGQQLLRTPGHFRTNTITTYFTNVSDQQIDNNNINNTNNIHFENHNNRGSIFPNENTTEMNVSDANDLMMMMIMNSSSMEQHYIATAFFNNSTSNMNMTGAELLNGNTSEYIFDRTDVRIIFITLYTIVFCCCFFGNLLVMLVVTLSRRLRSITNFFLANLALADFCVGLFCVMQNLSIYLIDSWVFGEFLCRMYQFVHSLSYTASIFILVVICMERYFAIVHPITCKQILTATRLRMVILTVWITSAVYSTPKFVFSKTIKNVHTESGQEEEICVLDRKMFNSKLLDMINFVLLYVIPLLVMTILYSKIAIALWRSSRGLSHHFVQKENGMGMHNSMYQQQQHHHHHNHNNRHAHHHCQNQNPHQHLCDHGEQQQQQQLNDEYGGGGAGGSEIATAGSEGMSLSSKHSTNCDRRAGVKISESQVTIELERPVVSACRKASFRQHKCLNQINPIGASNQRTTHMAHSSSNNVLRARRGVVRMLIIFVLTFALCNLPYHARKMWQYWSHSYRGDTNFNALFTPLTFLVTYFNSGINPLLYAFLSRNFRKGMRELLMCSWRTSKSKSSNNSVMHHKRATLQTHSLPTDTTHIGNEQL